MALEPYLRRRWPQSLISWTRLLAGDMRDPLVAGHILVGIALGVGVDVPSAVTDWLAWERAALPHLDDLTIVAFRGTGLAGQLFEAPIISAAFAMGCFFLFLLLRMILRNTWLAAAFVAFWGFSVATTTGGESSVLVFCSIFSALFLWVMIRFGVLPCALMLVAGGSATDGRFGRGARGFRGGRCGVRRRAFRRGLENRLGSAAPRLVEIALTPSRIPKRYVEK